MSQNALPETNISLYPLCVPVWNGVLCNYQLSLSGLNLFMSLPSWLDFTLGRLCSIHPLWGRSLAETCSCHGDGRQVRVQI